MNHQISNDRGIRLLFAQLSPDAQDAVLKRDEIQALKTKELGINEYLHLISNPEENIILA